MTSAEEPARRPAQRSHRRRSRRTWARATARSPAATRPAARRASSSTPRAATCTATGLAPGATYISDIGGVRNYTGNLADVFTCIAALGETGCGFEHQFAAITRALGADGRAARPPRTRASCAPTRYLAIVMITNEDDCSARRRACRCSTPARNTNIASQLGPPDELPLQRVRPPVRRRMHPHRADAPNNDVNADGQLRRAARRTTPRATCSRVARHREPDQGAQGRRRSGHGRRDHRPARRPTS